MDLPENSREMKPVAVAYKGVLRRKLVAGVARAAIQNRLTRVKKFSRIAGIKRMPPVLRTLQRVERFVARVENRLPDGKAITGIRPPKSKAAGWQKIDMTLPNGTQAAAGQQIEPMASPFDNPFGPPASRPAGQIIPPFVPSSDSPSDFSKRMQKAAAAGNSETPQPKKRIVPQSRLYSKVVEIDPRKAGAAEKPPEPPVQEAASGKADPGQVQRQADDQAPSPEKTAARQRPSAELKTRADSKSAPGGKVRLAPARPNPQVIQRQPEQTAPADTAAGKPQMPVKRARAFRAVPYRPAKLRPQPPLETRAVSVLQPKPHAEKTAPAQEKAIRPERENLADLSLTLKPAIRPARKATPARVIPPHARLSGNIVRRQMDTESTVRTPVPIDLRVRRAPVLPIVRRQSAQTAPARPQPVPPLPEPRSAAAPQKAPVPKPPATASSAASGQKPAMRLQAALHNRMTRPYTRLTILRPSAASAEDRAAMTPDRRPGAQRATARPGPQPAQPRFQRQNTLEPAVLNQTRRFGRAVLQRAENRAFLPGIASSPAEPPPLSVSTADLPGDFKAQTAPPPASDATRSRVSGRSSAITRPAFQRPAASGPANIIRRQGDGFSYTTPFTDEDQAKTASPTRRRPLAGFLGAHRAASQQQSGDADSGPHAWQPVSYTNGEQPSAERFFTPRQPPSALQQGQNAGPRSNTPPGPVYLTQNPGQPQGRGQSFSQSSRQNQPPSPGANYYTTQSSPSSAPSSSREPEPLPLRQPPPETRPAYELRSSDDFEQPPLPQPQPTVQQAQNPVVYEYSRQETQPEGPDLQNLARELLPIVKKLMALERERSPYR